MSDLKRRLAKMPPSKRREALESLPTYLAEASEGERLHSLLTNFDFIDAKISAVAPQPLIADYDLALKSELLASDGGLQRKADCLKLIQDALRLSAHILAQDKTQLAGQLLGRLLSFEVPEIQGILEQAKQWKAAPWLRPLTPTLTPPSEQLLRTLTGHTRPVTSVAVTSDGKRVISGSADNTLKVWNLETGEELFTLRGHTLPITSVAVTPDGKLAISGSWGKTLKVWDLEARKELFTLIGHTCMVTAISVTPDGKRVISGSLDKTLKVWDLEARKEVSTLTLKVYNWTGLLKLIRTILNPQVPFLFKFVLLFFTFLRVGWVKAVAVTPDGNQMISGSWDKTIKVWNLKLEKELFHRAGHAAGVNTVAVIPDGKQVISGSGDNTLKIWNWETGEEILTLKVNCFPTRITALAVTINGQQVIAGLSDKTIRAWNWQTGSLGFRKKKGTSYPNRSYRKSNCGGSDI